MPRKPATGRTGRDDPRLVPRLHESAYGKWHWKPERRLRPHWRNVPLGDDADAARAEARRLNREVEAWLRTATERTPRPPKPRSGAQTVGQLCAAFRAPGSDAWSTLRPRTRDLYTYLLKRLEKEFGHELAVAIDEVRVDEWIERESAGAPETVRHVAALGRRLFKWAGRKKLIARSHNPFTGAGTGGGAKRRYRFAWADVLHIMAVAAEERRPSVGIALVAAFCTMQRITDVIHLHDGMIVETRDAEGAPQRRLLFGQSKGRKIRRGGRETEGFQVDMILPAALEAALAKYRPALDRGAADRPFVISEETGAAYHEKTISRVFARILAKAIAKDRRKWKHLAGGQLRDGRRSGFVHMIEQGATVEFVTSISGHTITEGYDIVEHYMPRTKKMADQASAFMQVSL